MEMWICTQIASGSSVLSFFFGPLFFAVFTTNLLHLLLLRNTPRLQTNNMEITQLSGLGLLMPIVLFLITFVLEFVALSTKTGIVKRVPFFLSSILLFLSSPGKPIFPPL